MWPAIVLSVLLPLLICGVARAETLQAQCGAETGHAYVAEGGARSGWLDDATRGETVIRIDLDTGQTDIRFRDATGIWKSVSDGAATLFAAAREPLGAFMVVVMYPGEAIEVLTIAEIEGNSAILIHTLSRAMEGLTNSRVMTAECLLTLHE